MSRTEGNTALNETIAVKTTNSSQASIAFKPTAVVGIEAMDENKDASFNLQKVLLWSGIVGEQIKQFYDKNECLEEVHRTKLMSTIVDYCSVHGMKLSVGKCRTLASEIKETFPNEIESYYHKSQNGRLLSKFNHTLRPNKRLRDYIDKSSENVDTASDVTNNTKSQLNDDEIRAHISKLNNSSTLSADEFLELWRLTAQARCDYIKVADNSKSILVAWKQYKDAKAPEYVRLN